MRDKQWKEILSAIDKETDLNKDNIVEKIKEKLKVINSSIYEEWEKNDFDVNHLFCYLKDRKTLLNSATQDRVIKRIAREVGHNLLSLAVRDGYVKIAKALIEKGADISEEGIYQYTPLLLAVYYGHVEMVKVMIEKGANVNGEQGKSGKDPLCLAAGRGHIDIVKALIERGADVSKTGERALARAAENRHADIVKALIEAGASVNGIGRSRCTPLLFAIKDGDVKMVKALIEAGADVNSVANWRNECTFLQFAAENGHIEIIRALIEAGANVDVKDQDGRTLLVWATENSRIEIAKILIDKGADVNATHYVYTPLFWAIQNGLIEIAKALIEKGANVDDAMERSIMLIWAVKNGHIEMVNALIERDADVYAVSKGGQALLLWAARGGHLEIAKALVEKGADVNKASTNEMASLFSTVSRMDRNEDNGIAAAVMDERADFEIEAGWTPLTLAVKNGHIEMVNVLVDMGADVNKAYRYGNTPLTFAARNGNMKMVKALIDKGANIDAKAKREIFLHNHKPLIDALSKHCEYHFQMMTFTDIEVFFQKHKDDIILELGGIEKHLIDFVDFKDIKEEHVPRLELQAFAEVIKNNVPRGNLDSPNVGQHQTISHAFSS